MNFKRSIVFILFLLCKPLLAEVIGDLEFNPPVSLKEWVKKGHSPNKDDALEIYDRQYEHETDNFIEGLGVMYLHSKDPSLFNKDFSKKPDIKSYLTNKYQKIAEQTDPGRQFVVTVTDIIVDPNSLFYKVTTVYQEKVVAYSWCREITGHGRRVIFFYAITEKHPNDANFPPKDIEDMASSWIKFLKTFPKK